MKKLIILIISLSCFLLAKGQFPYKWIVPSDTIIQSGDTIAKIADVYFTKGREILRVWEPGQVIANDTDPYEWMFFTAPTLSAITLSPSTTLYEIGDSIRITLSGTTTNDGGATLANGALQQITDGVSLASFGSSTNYLYTTFDFNPRESNTGNYRKWSYSFRAQQYYYNSDSSEYGTIYSAVKTITAIYPFFYGITADDLTEETPSNLYTHSDLTKVIQQKGTKTLSFTGTGYMNILIPDTWSVSSITVKDETNSTISGYTKSDVTVTSSGLDGENYTSVAYDLWVGPTSGTYTAQNYTITFN